MPTYRYTDPNFFGHETPNNQFFGGITSLPKTVFRVLCPRCWSGFMDTFHSQGSKGFGKMKIKDFKGPFGDFKGPCGNTYNP